jgi:hypothetical protein
MVTTNAAIGAYVTLRAAAILTNSEVLSSALDLEQGAATAWGINPGTQRANGATLQISFTKGSLTSMTVKVYVSNDGGSTYFVCHEYDRSPDVDADDLQIQVAPFGLSDTHLKVGVTGVGTVTSSSCTIKAMLTGIRNITTTS